MLATLLSLIVFVAVFLTIFYFFGFIGAILPALAVLLVTFFLISKNIAKKLELAMKSLQEDLMKGHIDRAVKKLKEVKNLYGRWQFFLSSTIDGQIGSIYYMKGQYQTAKPYLERAFVRHWIAKAMLALIYYRERKMNKMNEVFEHATRYVKKAGLLWSLWAYCVWRNGEIDRAISILTKGKSYLNESDPHLIQNLLSLQNQKRMKMKAYGEQWYQFQLEFSPQQTQIRQGRIRFKNK
jgi:tetratricopeptide (TPR) repeat protein